MDEIGMLKKQKEGLIQDMINSKQNQMEEDHKIFQDKLAELKGEMIDNYQATKPKPTKIMGSEILDELDRMKERLQRGRKNGSKPRVHPSDKTIQDIIIDNPMAGKNHIDPTDYQPEKRSFQNILDKSLPGNTALKTGPNASQNFKIDKSLNIDPSKSDVSQINLDSPPPKPKGKRKIVIKNKVY